MHCHGIFTSTSRRLHSSVKIPCYHRNLSLPCSRLDYYIHNKGPLLTLLPNIIPLTSYSKQSSFHLSFKSSISMSQTTGHGVSAGSSNTNGATSTELERACNICSKRLPSRFFNPLEGLRTGGRNCINYRIRSAVNRHFRLLPEGTRIASAQYVYDDMLEKVDGWILESKLAHGMNDEEAEASMHTFDFTS